MGRQAQGKEEPAMLLFFAVDSTSLIQQRHAEGVPGDDQELLGTNPSTPICAVYLDPSKWRDLERTQGMKYTTIMLP